MKLLSENRGASLRSRSGFITGKGSLRPATRLMEPFNLGARDEGNTIFLALCNGSQVIGSTEVIRKRIFRGVPALKIERTVISRPVGSHRHIWELCAIIDFVKSIHCIDTIRVDR